MRFVYTLCPLFFFTIEKNKDSNFPTVLPKTNPKLVYFGGSCKFRRARPTNGKVPFLASPFQKGGFYSTSPRNLKSLFNLLSVEYFLKRPMKKIGFRFYWRFCLPFFMNGEPRWCLHASVFTNLNNRVFVRDAAHMGIHWSPQNNESRSEKVRLCRKSKPQ